MNVNLWFAKNSKDDIVLITEIDEQNRNEKYICPVCGSEVIPKAIGEDCVVSRHFAHSDKSKCSSESQIHFFFKHKLIEIGDKFKVLADKEYEFVCKDIQVEQEHKTEFGAYIPDMTVYTECGETIYFEMNYKNKKKIDDYIDKWIDLGKIVVEVDVKDMLDKDEISLLKALYYKNKVVKSEKTAKMSRINKYKTELLAKDGIDNPNTVKRLRGLTWFFNDLIKYNKDGDNIKLLMSLDYIKELNNDDYIFTIRELRNKHCSDLYFDYLKYSKRDFICELKKDMKEYGLEDVELVLDTNKGSNYNTDWISVNGFKISGITSTREIAKNIFKTECAELINQRKEYLNNIVIGFINNNKIKKCSIKMSDYTDYTVSNFNVCRFYLWAESKECVINKSYEVNTNIEDIEKELSEILLKIKTDLKTANENSKKIDLIYEKLSQKYIEDESVSVNQYKGYYSNKIDITIGFGKHQKNIDVSKECLIENAFDIIVEKIENDTIFKNRKNTFKHNLTNVSNLVLDLFKNDNFVISYHSIKIKYGYYLEIDKNFNMIVCMNNKKHVIDIYKSSMLEEIKNIMNDEYVNISNNLYKETIKLIETNENIKLTIETIGNKHHKGVYSTVVVDNFNRRYQLETIEDVMQDNIVKLNTNNILYYSDYEGITYVDFNNLIIKPNNQHIAFSFKKNLHSSKYLSEFDFVKATQLLEENYVRKSDMLGGIIWTDGMITEKFKLSKDKTFEILRDIMESINKNTYGFVLNDTFTMYDDEGRKQLWLIKDFCTAFEKSTGYKTINIK